MLLLLPFGFYEMDGAAFVVSASADFHDGETVIVIISTRPTLRQRGR